MRKLIFIIVFSVLAVVLILLAIGASAQTNGQVMQVKKGSWFLYQVLDTTGLHIPLNDSTWIVTPDTVLVWHVVVDTVKMISPPITITTTVYDTMWQCNTTQWCPTKPVIAALSTIFTTQIPVSVTDIDYPANTNIIGIEVGMRWHASVSGYIKGVRFYKTTGNSGTHIGELYTTTGGRLASATFTGESATGWQTVSFPGSIAVAAGTNYVIAYFSSAGYYVEDNNYFTKALVSGNLTAIADGTAGKSGTDPGTGNGMSLYTANPAFPNQLYKSANYYVDVIFSTTP